MKKEYKSELCPKQTYCGEDENYWSTSYDDTHQFSCPNILGQGMSYFEVYKQMNK